MVILQTIFEFIPVTLAVVAIMMCGNHFKCHRRRFDKIKVIVSIVAALLLIITQTSWYFTAIIGQKLEDNVPVNYLWTIFNSLAMLLIILHAYPRKVKNAQNAVH